MGSLPPSHLVNLRRGLLDFRLASRQVDQQCNLLVSRLDNRPGSLLLDQVDSQHHSRHAAQLANHPVTRQLSHQDNHPHFQPLNLLNDLLDVRLMSHLRLHHNNQ